MTINKTTSRNILRKITEMINASNEEQRRASASIHWEYPFSSATPHAEKIEQNIGLLIHDRVVRQCHFPGKQNRVEDRYEEDAYYRDDERQYAL